ncbi:MAG: PilN domain-containing protein, partial [Actinomycetota bacterium]
MRRIELIPESYIQRRKQRRTIVGIVFAGALALLLLLAYWFFLGMQISEQQEQLATAQARNASLQAQITELQQFAELETEVENKQTALQTVMAGDVDWPALLTEVSMVVPSEVWLSGVTASAGTTEGATQVPTETAAVRVAKNPTAFGRVQFTGKSLSMPGIAKWLIRLDSVKEFEAVWLNSAQESEQEGG